MLKIKQVEAKGIRGIVDGPSLSLPSGGLILCGDNGTGKSSYVDAIEKALTGNCSSLEKIGQGVSWNKQGHHLSSNDSNISITLTDGNKNVVIDLGMDTSTLDSQTRTFLEAAQQHSFILRRRTLLNFIDSKPSERYQAIEKFINIDRFNAFEEKLKSLGKNLDASIENEQDKKAGHESALREILELNKNIPVTKDVCLDAINAALEEVKISRLVSLDDIEIRIQEISNLISPVKNIAGLQKTQALYETIEQIPSVETLLENSQKYARDRKELFEEESKVKGHLYVQVLEHGLHWIKEDNLQNCPLCNNPISLPDVESHIASCLENNKGLIASREKLANSQSSFVELVKSFAESLERVFVSWEKTVEIKTPVDINSSIKALKALVVSHKKTLSLSQIENDIVKLTTINLNAQVFSLKSAIEGVLSEFPGSDRYIKLFDIKNKLSGFDTHYIKGVLKVVSRIENLTVSKNHVAVVLGVAETSRKATVQKLLDAIVSTADKYFQKIHPGEEIGKPELIISSRGTGSIELKSEFHGETGDPRGHYSEGHVDSLGLCLFLSIRRLQSLQKPELSLLILDDVMHSVDARHRLDTAKLIIEEFADHQIIITTHDPFWFEYLKMITKKSKNLFDYKRIAEWTLQGGPIFGDHFSNYEWLVSRTARSAKPSDRVVKAGLLLEEMLQNLCNNLAISVTFKIRGDYTIEPLWSGFYPAAKKHKGFSSTANDVLQKIEDLKNLRNWAGAHWNQWAQTLTSSEADRFVDAVVALRSIVYCEECNQFIARIGGLDGVWSCKSEHKRYNKNV